MLRSCSRRRALGRAEPGARRAGSPAHAAGRCVLLLELDRYASLALQISRGCSFNGEFCDIIEIFGRVPRVKAPQQALAELEALRTLGARGSLFVVDDNFTGNRKAAARLLPAEEVLPPARSPAAGDPARSRGAGARARRCPTPLAVGAGGIRSTLAPGCPAPCRRQRRRGGGRMTFGAGGRPTPERRQAP